MSALSNPEIEASVLGCAILDKEALYRIVPLLSPDDFSLDSHRRIYHAVLELANAGEPVDDFTVCKALTAAGQLEAVGGMAAVSNLGTNVALGMARIANVENYAKTILDKSRRRKMHAAAIACQAAAEDARTSTDDCSREIQEALLAIEASSGNKLGWHIREIAPEANAEIERQSQTRGLVGFRTGIHLLDKMTGGIRRGELWTVGALPGKGKTSCGLQIISENAAKKVPVMVFSIEMTRTEIYKRFLAATSTVSASQIRNPHTVSQEGWRELAKAAGEVTGLPIYGDDRGTLKIDQLLSSARLNIRRHGVQLIVVDYLQIVQAPGRDPKERVAYSSNALRQLAKSENVAVVQLSQLARPRDINDRPTMIQLKESGDVEAHSHVIVMPYLPVDDSGELIPEEQFLIVAKNRNGSVGQVPVYFDTARLQFVERTRAQ
jgi:replicative DNA helicase